MKSLIFILTVFLLTGCGLGEEKITRSFRLFNHTPHTVKVETYKNKIFQESSQITGQGLFFEAKVKSVKGSSLSAVNAFSADSIVVTYDNSKQQAYYIHKYDFLASPKSDRNLFFDSDYTVMSYELYDFYFTQEDYLKADSVQ